MKRLLPFFFSIFLFVFISGNFFNPEAQTKNTLVEFCTGTWCQWCPCGDFTIENLLEDYPNLIPLAYHGPVGSDPYASFPGNSIISLLGFSGYPTGVINRTNVPGDYTTWTSRVINQSSALATVTIDMDKSFDPTTGQLEATIYMTPLQDLSGQYYFNFVLTEDSLIYDQINNNVCVTGGAGWVHLWVVRDMINGASGQSLNTSSPWLTGDMITKTVSYNVSSNYNADKCHLVVFVYKQNSPMYMAEVQQAEKWTLISPDYVATASTTSPDVIADHNTPANFDVVIKNRGLLSDTYDISAEFTGPSGWGIEFTTINGTYALGETDSVQVVPGDSTVITVTVNPNGIDGSGKTRLNYASRYAPGNHGRVAMRNVTTTGVYALVVDGGDGYSAYIDSSMRDVFGETYGMVSRNAFQSGVDLSHFYLITWSQGNTLPAFHPDEVDALQAYLTGGGNLFINGQNIGSDIFEAGGQSQFAQDFYHNYLHAAYVADASTFFLMKGVPGDVIGDGLQFIPGFIYEKSLEKISRYDSYADSILTYSTGPSVSAIKADNGTSRVVYLGFGLEQIDDRAIRDTLFARSVNWLTENVVVGTRHQENIQYDFNLDQNYPNPFNPTTKIKYSVPSESFTTLKVYDVLGNEVASLVNERRQAGSYEVEYNAANLASGIYFYKLQSSGAVLVRKMVVLK